MQMMKYLVRVAAVLLFTAIAVKGQASSGPPNSSPVPCIGGSSSSTTYTWNQTDNIHALGGTPAGPAGDQSLDACKSSCTANSSCAGIDWDPLNNAGQKCWWTWPGSTKQPSTGVTHYELTRTTTPGSGGGCAVDCSMKWADPLANTNVAGGTANGAASLDGCKQACEALPTCRGVDWDSNTGASSKCWLTGDGAPRTGLASGVAHYSILSRPGSECTTGCIFVSVEGKGVVTVDDNGYLVFSDNLDDGTVFQLAKCLLPPSDSYNESCVSYTLFGQPNVYIRNFFGKLYLDSASTSDDSSISPTKFKEDASFTKQVLGTGQQFMLGSPFSNEVMVGADDGYVAFVPASAAAVFYCYPTQSNTLVTAQCPNVWSRVDNARFALSNTQTVSTSCRPKAIASGLAVGVSTSNCLLNATCILLSSNADDALQPDNGYTHYDLWRQFSGTCNRGCVYAWEQSPGTSIAYRLLDTHTAVANTYMCQKICIQVHKWACDAVSYNVTTGSCKILQFGTPTYTQSNVWKLYPQYTGCGPCISSVAYIYDYTDLLAVATAATGSTQCRTACLNRGDCSGYETRNNTCYLSINSSLVYTKSTGSRITAVYKNPCGNGCIHKWDLYAGYYIEAGGTVQNATTVTTETNCRFECINVPTCTGCDWYRDTKRCVLAIGNPSTSHKPPPLSTVNHYELHRNDDCDCADGPCEGY